MMEPELPLLDDYILALSGKRQPKIAFVPTAGGDSEQRIAQFYAAFPASRARASHLSLFRRTIADLRAYALEQHVIYVGGGNAANMLAVWRVHGFDAVLREAWESGVVLAGVSAGSLCWFECGVTDSYGKELRPLAGGLGLLAGSHCPHYDGEPLRRPAYRRFVGEGMIAGLAADDGAGLHFVGTELREVVSSRQGAAAYRVELGGDGVMETRIDARWLGG